MTNNYFVYLARKTLNSPIMERRQLIHNNEYHFISQPEIRKAAGKLVETLNLAAGSTDNFDIYKVIDVYFRDLNMRHKINKLLGIADNSAFLDKEDSGAEKV